MQAILEIKRLTVELATTAGGLKPVNEVSLELRAGEALGLVGESGSGKTMLSLALMGLLPLGARVSGEISWREAERKIGTERGRGGAIGEPDCGMRAGRFVECGPADQVLREPAEGYTRELLEAVPQLPVARQV